MQGLTIDTERLRRIADAREAREQAEANGESFSGAGMSRTVSPEVIASTRSRYPSCSCDEIGLVAGMPIAALRDLEEGCSGARQRGIEGVGGGWVCERLTAVRRAYGK